MIDPVVPARSDEAPESWDSSSAPTTAVMPKPPSPETVMEAINRRTQETKNGIATTIFGVAMVRKETREDIAHATTRIDALATELADARAELVRRTEQNDLQNVAIIRLLEDQNKAREQREADARARETEARARSGMMRLAGFNAELELSKADKLAAIEIAKAARLLALQDGADAKKTKRQVVLQFVGACTGTAVVTALIALLTRQC